MTDPLTPEQRETLREKRRMMEFQLARISDLGPQADNWALDVLIGIRDIFVIIDSLPAPKQYTEEQLREGFESWVKKNWRAYLHKKALKREGAGYHSSTVNDHWTGWINGARYTNSLMEPHA